MITFEATVMIATKPNFDGDMGECQRALRNGDFRKSAAFNFTDMSRFTNVDAVLLYCFGACNHGSPYCDESTYRDRSLSVGDVVQVNNEFYMCAPIGWENVKF